MRVPDDSSSLEPLERVARQQEIIKKYQVFDRLLKELLENAQQMQAVGLSSAGDLALFDKLLEQLSIKVSCEVKLMLSRLSV